MLERTVGIAFAALGTIATLVIVVCLTRPVLVHLWLSVASIELLLL